MMPVLFVGHGSPMNIIEDNQFTQGWRQITSQIPTPDAILCISAHWETNGTSVLSTEFPHTIHDFYGFPKALYEITYPAKGSLDLVNQVISLLGENTRKDSTWGFDHGAWCVLHTMYPKANIPTIQLSIDQNATPEELFQIGKKLKFLRDQNILILGSGNVVHNLRMLDFSVDGGFDWAYEFDHFIETSIKKREYRQIIAHRDLGLISKYSIPTTEHFNPLLFVLGAADSFDQVTVFNRAFMAGSLSMTSYLFQ